jgi:TonB family protein
MIRASLLLAVVWCAARLLKQRPAAERHLLWAAAIVMAALLPLLGSVVPAWSPESAGRWLEVLPSLSRIIDTAGIRPSTGTTIRAIGIEGGSLSPWFLVWLAGSLIALGRLFSGIRSGRRLAAMTHTVPDPDWLQLARTLAGTLGVKRQVRLLQGPGTTPPVTWGLLRPRIMLPERHAAWSSAQKFSVLAHELEHVRRCDWASQLLAEAACVVYWFNPLFWIARNHLHVEAERACDDAVLRLNVDGRDYAQHLVDVARAVKRWQAWAVPMAGAVPLETRLVAILNSHTKRDALSRTTKLSFLGILILLVAPLAAMRFPEANPAVSPSAVLRYTAPPLYSDEALQRRVEGVVVVEARVDNRGRAHDLHVVRGLGFGLDENALLAVRSWEFLPSRADTTAVVRVDVEFSLETAELNEMIANDMVTLVGPDVVAPRIVHRVDARYPAGGELRGGTVVLDAVIQDDGVPRVLRVVRSLSWEMDEVAIAALEQWRFTPAEREGAPVKVRMNVEMPVVPLAR